MIESWNDKLIMEYTELLAKRSVCKKMRFGATIIKDGVIVASGINHPYNRMECNPCLREKPEGCFNYHPYDAPDGKVKSGTHLELCRAIHAEQDALLYALRHQIDIKGGIMYVAGVFPDERPFLKETKCFYCTFCSRLIHDSGLIGIKIRMIDGSIPMLLVEEIMETSFNIAKGI